MKTKVFTKPLEVDNRLRDLGIEREQRFNIWW